MKKLILFTMGIAGAMSVLSQEVVTSLGQGDYNYAGPIWSSVHYTYSQTIYYADDIDASGNIDSICYMLADTGYDISKSNEWTVLLGHTNKTLFYGQDYEYNIDTVFSGTVYIVNDSVCIPFDQPFNYNGVDNLVISVAQNKYGTVNNSSAFIGTWNGIQQSLGDNNAFFPYHPTYVNYGNPNVAHPDVALYGIEPSCARPSNLSVSDITTSSAVLHWEGGAPQYEVDYALEGTAPGAGTTANVTSNTLSISSLEPSENYRFYVKAICGSDDSSIWTLAETFSSDCHTLSPPFEEEGFAVVPPLCWSGARGQLSNSTTFTDNVYSDWYAGYFANSWGGSGLSASFQTQGNDPQKEWLISPSYDLGDGSANYLLEFKMRGAVAINWNGGAASLSADDTLRLLISTDNGVTWSTDNVIETWDSISGLPSTTEYKQYDLSAYTGSVKFAFYAQSTVPNTTEFRMFVDNFKVVKCTDNIVVNDTSCISYTSLLGEVYESSGTYHDTISNTCDTVYTFNLTISPSHELTYVEISECDSFVSVTNKVYTQSGVYHDTIPNSSICDSIAVTELYIVHINPSVAQIGDSTLKATESDPVATYQWVKCSDLSPLSGETSQTVALTNTDTTIEYACQITIGNCSKLSDCIKLKSTVSVDQYSKSDIKVYPNPNNGQFMLELSEAPHAELNMSISNTLGQLIYSQPLSSTRTPINLGRIDKGVYILHLNSSTQSLKSRIVID